MIILRVTKIKIHIILHDFTHRGTWSSTAESTAGNGTNAPVSKPATKIDTSNVDLTKPPPSLEKKDVKNMSKDDLQSLIAARIQAGKKSHAYVAKLEEQHEKKVAAGKPSY